MDSKELLELVNLVCEKDIKEFEVEREGFRLRIVKGRDAQVVVSGAPPSLEPPVAVEAVAASLPTAAGEPAVEEGIVTVTSPIVGTFYRSPSPTTEPYVKVGDVIKKGQVLCIVEAMKLMNEIESEVSGVVVDVIVESGQPVEYNEVLFKVRPSK